MNTEELKCIFGRLDYFAVRVDSGRVVFMNPKADPKLSLLMFSIQGRRGDEPAQLLDFLAKKGFDRGDVVQAFADCGIGQRR